MPSRSTPLVTGEYYHIYNRGNSKQVIFHDDQDHGYFMNLLFVMNNEKRTKARDALKVLNNEEKLVSIGAYCLMPNHFHILFKQEKEQGITTFMQKLSTAYVMYYNKKYKRSGGLFEGKFKSKYAGEDLYLKYLFSYIHLNPLKILDQNWKKYGLGDSQYKFLLEYKYSSFNEYQKEEYHCINKEAFPDYFPNKAIFVKEIRNWVSLED